MTDSLYMPLLERVQHLQGVDSAGLMSEVPLGNTFIMHLALAGEDQVELKPSRRISRRFSVSDGCRAVLFPQDTANAQSVIVVNPAYAADHSPDPHNPLAILGHKVLSLIKGGPQIRSSA